MSRHELTPLAGREGVEIAIGWDPPLATYFAIVRFSDDLAEGDGDPFLVWIGTSYAEISSASTVVEAARDFAHVPLTLVETLRADRKGDR
jgi:hypothetical protein